MSEEKKGSARATPSAMASPTTSGSEPAGPVSGAIEAVLHEVRLGYMSLDLSDEEYNALRHVETAFMIFAQSLGGRA